MPFDLALEPALAVIPALLAIAAWAMTLAPREPSRPDTLGARDSAGRPWRGRGWALLRRGKEPPIDVGRVLTEVAARLRAGAPLAAAWSGALPAGDGAEALSKDGVPTALAGLVPARRRWRGYRHAEAALASQIAAAQVACKVAHSVGAPLSVVLQACADGVAEAGRAEAARRAALAGPKATALLLGWLPVLGVGLGVLLGADPIGVLLGGGWGQMCLVLGTALMVAGHVWASRLVRAAEGREP